MYAHKFRIAAPHCIKVYIEAVLAVGKVWSTVLGFSMGHQQSSRDFLKSINFKYGVNGGLDPRNNMIC